MMLQHVCYAFLIVSLLSNCRGRDSWSGLQDEASPAADTFTTEYEVSGLDLGALLPIQKLMASDGRSWDMETMLVAYERGVKFTTVKKNDKPVAVIAWSVNNSSKDPTGGKTYSFIEIQEFAVDPYLESKYEEPLLRYLTRVMEKIRTDFTMNKVSSDLPILFKALYAFKEKFSRLKAIGFQTIDKIGDTIMPTLERGGEAGGNNYDREGILGLGLDYATRDAVLRAFSARSELSLQLRQGTSQGSDPISLAIVSEFARDLRRHWLQRPDQDTDLQTLDRAAEETALTMSIIEGASKSLVIFGAKGEGKSYFSKNFLAALVRGQFPRDNEEVKSMLESLGKDYLLYEVSGSSVKAGTEYHGKFEERLKALKKVSGDGQRRVLLFIDEVHEFLKEPQILDAIKTELAEGWLQIIGTSTWPELRKSSVVLNEAGTDRFILWEMASYSRETIIEIIKDLHVYRSTKGRGIKTSLSPDVVANAIFNLAQSLIPNAGRVRGPVKTIYPMLKFLSLRTPLNSVREMEQALLQRYRASPDSFFPVSADRMMERQAELKERIQKEIGTTLGAEGTAAMVDALSLHLTQESGNTNLLTLSNEVGSERPDIAQSVAKAMSRAYTTFDAQLVARGGEAFEQFMFDFLVKNEMKGAALSVVYIQNLSKIPSDSRAGLLAKIKDAQIDFQTPDGSVVVKRFPSILFVAADKSGENATVGVDFFNRIEIAGDVVPKGDRFEELLSQLRMKNPDLVKAFNEEHLKVVKDKMEKRLATPIPDNAALSILTLQMTTFATEQKLLGACEANLAVTNLETPKAP